MEIDKAIKESDDRRLKTKYSNAIYIIQRALTLYSIEEVALSFNGGKDSTVLLHLLRAGYYLHQCEKIETNYTDNSDIKFPIRTIYFESSSAFPDINLFTYETAATYGLQIDTLREDFKSGLEGLLKSTPIKAIFLGVRIGDPTAVGQEQFSPSSPGWPSFMRVNPILDWSYRDVWAFLLTSKVQYCRLYDQGYTSIGSIHDTVPNELLSISNSPSSEAKFKPAYLLSDGRLERAGRIKKSSRSLSGRYPVACNGLKNEVAHSGGILTASVIAVGDEILSGSVKDLIGPSLRKKLHSIGWLVSHGAVVSNSIDSVAEEVERCKATNDMVFIYGGVGPLHSDVAVAGVAKAFGVRTAPDEEFEEYLRHLIGEKCTGDKNEMAQLPEGITELLHHERLPVPLIKCLNVIVLVATNKDELDMEWAEASSQPAMVPTESDKELKSGDVEVGPSVETELPAEVIERQSELQEGEANIEEGDGKGGEDEEEEEEDCQIEEGETEGERPKLAEGFYEIETVRKKRVRKGEAQYLIKWRGWPETANTWEPFENLLACSDIIDAFEESLRSGKHKSTRGRKRKSKTTTTPSQAPKKQRISSAAANYNYVTAVKKVRVTEEPAPIGSPSDTSPTKERCKQGNNEVRTVIIRPIEETKEQDELHLKLHEARGSVSVSCNERDTDNPKTHDQESDVFEMNGHVNGFLTGDNIEQSHSGRCTGAKRRKSGSVKRFKQETSSNLPNDEPNKIVRSSNGSCSKSGWKQDSFNPDFAGSELGLTGLLENSNAVATITEIVRPISYSSTTIDNVNEVSVHFIAMRSDGREVVVDNKFLKANNPLLLINFYEQHLRYSQTP